MFYLIRFLIHKLFNVELGSCLIRIILINNINQFQQHTWGGGGGGRGGGVKSFVFLFFFYLMKNFQLL